MKRLNSHNLLITSLLGLSKLFANSYPLVKAQLEPKLGRQATVDKVLEEIRLKGVWVKFEIDKGVANENHTGNPTNRIDVLHIVFGDISKDTVRSISIIENIMGSSVLIG